MLSSIWNRSRLFTLLLCTVVVVSVHLPSRAFCGGQPQPMVGRFEAVAGPDKKVYLIDTTTGRCWRHEGDTSLYWADLGFPVKETKVENGVVGRFRLTVTSGQVLRQTEVVLVVLDTASGRCWRHFDEWKAIPAPPSK
jgi:hypothetical protein